MESLQQLRFADVIHSILEGTSETKLIEASRVAFGDRIELNRLNDLVQQWKIGDFSALPEITILPGNNLNGARGAYSAQTNTIYLSQEFITNASNPADVNDVLLEEVGHFIDSVINPVDAPGDEGEIFANLIQGKTLTSQQLENLRNQNDAITIQINGQVLQAEAADTKPEDNLGIIATAIKPYLEKVRSAIDTLVLDNIPLLNTFSLKDYANKIISDEVENKLISAFEKTENKSVESIKQALFDALGPSGLNLLLDLDADGKVQLSDIQAPKDANSLEFKFKLGKNFNPDLPLNSNSLGLNLKGNLTPELTLGVMLGFGVDDTSLLDGKPSADAFFVDVGTTNEIDGKLNVKFTDKENKPLSFTGDLGFVKLNATDNGSNLTSNFSIDIKNPEADGKGRVKSTAIPSISTDKPKLDANASLNLRLDTGLLNGILPSLKSDFSLSGLNYQSGDSTQSTPVAELKNVTIDSGSLVSGLLGKVLEPVQSVTGAFQKPIDIITSPLPLIKKSLVYLAQEFPKGGGFDSVDPFLKGLKTFTDAATAINSLKPSSSTIDLGDYKLDKSGFSTIRETAPIINQLKGNALVPQSVVPQFAALAPTLASSPNSDNLLSTLFPVLNNSSQFVNLLLGGQDTNLFEYTTPTLGFKFELAPEPIVPVFGPVVLKFGASAGAGAQLTLGLDSKGFKEYKEEGFKDPSKILNGLYVGKAEPRNLNGKTTENSFEVFGGINARAAVDVGIAEFAAGGGVFLTAGLEVKGSQEDENKSYIKQQSNPLCLFDKTGALSLVVFASLRLNFGFFKVTKRLNLANVDLIDYRGKTCGDEKYKVQNPPLTSEIRAQLAGQGIIEREGTEQNDVITLEGTELFLVNAPKKLKDSNTVVNGKVNLLGLDSKPQEYTDVQLIVINGGKGNDRIEFKDQEETNLPIVNVQQSKDIVASGQLDGGEGDDTLIGGRGDDYLTGGSGQDTLNGGTGGRNTAVYSNAPEGKGVKVDLVQNFALDDGFGTTDTLINIQNIEGSSGNDILIGRASGDPKDNNFGSLLDGGAGNDTLIGGEGEDVLLGGAGADFIDGKGGLDTTTYLDSTAPVYVNLSSGRVRITSPINLGTSIQLNANAGVGGDAEGDKIFNVENVQGSVYDDILVANGKDSRVDGLLGNDIIIAAPEAQILDGGPGIDWVTYQLSDSGVNVSLKSGLGKALTITQPNILPGFPPIEIEIGSGGYGKDDTLEFAKDANNNVIKDQSSFENLEGSNFDDILEGDLQDNILRGLAGNDKISGGDGNDTLIGGAGADVLDGGNGIDWADYSESFAGVIVNLKTNSGLGGDAQGDTFARLSPTISTIENLLGSKFSDTLTGDDGNNEIKPGYGQDTVYGEGGNDRLSINYSNSVDFFEPGSGVTGGYYPATNPSYSYSSSGITYNPGSVGSVENGFISRRTSDGAKVLDSVAFFGIENLTLIGTSFADSIFSASGNDFLNMGDGDDIITSGQGSDRVFAGSGNDIVVSQNDLFGRIGGIIDNAKAVIELDGGAGIDTLSVNLSGKKDSISLFSFSSTQENPYQSFSIADGTVSIKNFEIFKDIITGNGDDFLTQLGRVDNIFATGGGNDTVDAGLGFDNVDGGDLNDLLYINYSLSDTGSGMSMTVDPLKLVGSASRTKGGTSSELLDKINFSNFERFNITGTSKADTIMGGDGADILRGSGGDDTLIGNRGNDQLFGGDGNDILQGTNYISYLIGGGGEFKNYDYPKDIDTLTGGTGADTFVLGNSPYDKYYFGNLFQDYAIISDFKSSEGDKITLSGSDDQYTFEVNAGSTSILRTYESYGPDLIAVVQGVTDLEKNANYITYLPPPPPVVK
ncbi:calcium-binding protein [Brasilonema bromeliae]|uniref:Uncharacterized protein n=1 Tax=Brasilonema bromeliae SPC951 TaxID=385972 RepID=A0ABX1P1X4_9CYAN|nr:calcium-binding protein [Brasilonema bromeliae]NMG18330.1 hypothetical protein [Brasilonema bromeliae SPC951]